MTKICTKCKEDLPIKSFGKHKLRKDGLQSVCKNCKSKIDKIYCALHKEKKLNYDKKRRGNEAQHEKDKRNIRRRKLYTINPSSRKKSNKKWKRNNPDKVMLQAQRRRARIKNAKGTFNSNEWKYIKNLFKYRCAYCAYKKKLTVDHVIPLSKNGDHNIKNIVPACINCNSQKHSNIIGWPIFTNKRYIIEFYRQTFDDAKRMAIAFSSGVS